jgi:hypothetical protein
MQFTCDYLQTHFKPPEGKGPFGARAVSCEYLAGPRKTPDTRKIQYLVSRDIDKKKVGVRQGQYLDFL